jgi:hypothetical protein
MSDLRMISIPGAVAEKTGETMRKARLIMAFIMICYLWSPDAIFALTPLQNQRGKVVKIYLRNDLLKRKTDDPMELLMALAVVSRRVDAAAPARGALNALLVGPTAAEKNRGFESPHAEYLSLRRLVIRHGLASVSLRTTRRMYARWPGDLSPGRFADAITRTLKQFSTVKRVAICLDGETSTGKDDSTKRCK